MARPARPFPTAADGTPQDSLLPQSLTASRRGRGTCAAARTGRTGAGCAGPGARPAASHQLTFNRPGSGERCGPGTGREGGNFSNGGRRTESGEPSEPGTTAPGSGRAGQEPQSPESAQDPAPPPRRPPRLPPGGAQARSGWLARPRSLLVFLFLVPGRASGSEEPGEAVPGAAAPPPAAGHLPGAAARPGPSAGSWRGGVLRPEPSPGGTDWTPDAGVAQSIPSRRGGRDALPDSLPLLGAAAPPPAPAGRPGEEPEATAPPRPVLASPRSSRAGRVAAESADLGPGARNSPPTTLAQGFAPQASSGCILSGFALNSDFIWVICFLSSSQCTESFQTFGRGLRTKVCESTW